MLLSPVLAHLTVQLRPVTHIVALLVAPIIAQLLTLEPVLALLWPSWALLGPVHVLMCTW